MNVLRVCNHISADSAVHPYVMFVYCAVRGWLVVTTLLLTYTYRYPAAAGPDVTWTAASTVCSPPSLLNHSTFSPALPAGTDFTGYCNFNIGSQPEIAGEIKIDLSAHPAMDDSYTTSEQWAADNLTVLTTITILNISQGNSGEYLFTVTNKCGSQSCNFVLNVLRSCEYDPPDPGNDTHRSVVVPESPHLLLRVNYSGDPDPIHYNIVWQRQFHGDLVKEKYYSYHTRLDVCAFSSSLNISDVSYLDSGNYTAVPYGLFSSTDDSRKNVTVDLRVIPWPVVTEHPGETVQLHSTTTILKYTISNYTTKYVNVSFTRNGTLINPPQSGYSITITPSGDKDTPCNATVSLMISNGQPGDYRMCTGLTLVASDPQCTVPTTITSRTGSKESHVVLIEAVCGGGGGCLLLGLMVVAIVAYNRRCRSPPRRSCSQLELLMESNHGARVGVEMERDGPVVSKVQTLLQRCVPEDFKEIEFESIAEGMLRHEKLVCPKTLALRLLGNTSAYNEVRYQSDSNLRTIYRGVLRAWFDDIPYTVPAIETRRELVRVIYEQKVFDLAEAIALKTYTRLL